MIFRLTRQKLIILFFEHINIYNIMNIMIKDINNEEIKYDMCAS